MFNTFIKNSFSSTVAFGTLALGTAIGITLTNSSSVNAAIFALDDSNSWATGTDTLEAILGFNMVDVPDPGLPEFTDVTTLPSPKGDLTFDPAVNYRLIGSGWATWSHGYTEEVYYSNGATSVMIEMPDGTDAFDLYVEPNPLSVIDITVTAQNGTTTSLTQAVDGEGGAKYYGFYALAGDWIDKITVSADVDFAVGEFRLATTPTTPEPTTVLGLLAVGGLGLAMKRKKQS